MRRLPVAIITSCPLPLSYLLLPNGRPADGVTLHHGHPRPATPALSPLGVAVLDLSHVGRPLAPSVCHGQRHGLPHAPRRVVLTVDDQVGVVGGRLMEEGRAETPAVARQLPGLQVAEHVGQLITGQPTTGLSLVVHRWRVATSMDQTIGRTTGHRCLGIILSGGIGCGRQDRLECIHHPRHVLMCARELRLCCGDVGADEGTLHMKFQ
mmetsp:Transcript_43605/g.123554  ORF Transcript_43605/g.123554 Transcript_43605/m.123554 type:complete len:209 (+) Transcript_43605:113-739(+)